MPAPPRRLEQHEGAEHVGLDELARGLDRAVHVRLGGEVDDRVAALDRGARRRRGRRCPPRPARRGPSVEALEVLAPPRVGELVEHADVVVRVGGEPAADVGRADEPAPPATRILTRPPRALARPGTRPGPLPVGQRDRVRALAPSTEYAGRGALRASISRGRRPSPGTRRRPGRRSPGRTRTTSTALRPRCDGSRTRSPSIRGAQASPRWRV